MYVATRPVQTSSGQQPMDLADYLSVKNPPGCFVRTLETALHYVIKGRFHCVIILDKGNEVHRVFPKENSQLHKIPRFPVSHFPLSFPFLLPSL